jgi:hypothetical protein
MEQMERGTLSPGFDALWNQSIVVLGNDADLENTAILSSLLEKIFWNHPYLLLQTALLLLCMIIFWGVRRLGSSLRIGIALLILLLFPVVMIMAVRQGLILPFTVPLLTGLLLLIPEGSTRSK